MSCSVSIISQFHQLAIATIKHVFRTGMKKRTFTLPKNLEDTSGFVSVHVLSEY